MSYEVGRLRLPLSQSMAAKPQFYKFSRLSLTTNYSLLTTSYFSYLKAKRPQRGFSPDLTSHYHALRALIIDGEAVLFLPSL